MNTGVMFGPKETTTGGKALKFYASLRLDVRKIASLKKDDLHFGNRVAVKAVKNKVAPPFRVLKSIFFLMLVLALNLICLMLLLV